MVLAELARSSVEITGREEIVVVDISPVRRAGASATTAGVNASGSSVRKRKAAVMMPTITAAAVSKRAFCLLNRSDTLS
jgi:hypothetical protein